jgi:hypothetical protein
VNKTQATALLKAAGDGDVAKIRTLLADGAPIEATDYHLLTPVMVAAKAGHLDAVRTLAAAGANLHAVGLDQTDLLECAAEGGHAEVIRFLLDQGLPVEGHWQPRSAAERREGHFTPLLSAAVDGHAAAVRVLLAAGADPKARFDGQTALQFARDGVKFPVDPTDVEGKRRYQEIIALLTGSAGAGEPLADPATGEVGRFAENARRPAYRQFRKQLEEKCGRARSWKPVQDHGLPAAGAVGFTLAECDQRTLDGLQAAAREAGCYLVVAEPWSPGDDAALVLFPTADKFAVIAAVGSEGANYSLQTPDVIAWLREVEADNPFHLTFCRHDMVGGTFVGAVKGVKGLAGRMAKFCPVCLGEGTETSAELALELKRGRSFLLWWD